MSNDPQANFEALKLNPYPGRGIIVGLDETGGNLVQVYWIMGRSENSRNRVFEAHGTTLKTAAADPSKMADPSLVIYNAMRELPGFYAVTNGDQTDTIIDGILAGANSRQALSTRQYEPDGPNFTPRISAICCLRFGIPIVELSVLKKSLFRDGCDRHFFRLGDLAKGVGHCITTYMGDGNPLPSFQGEPYPLPLAGDAETLAKRYFEALNADNRVSLVVKFIDIESRKSTVAIENKYQKA